MKATCMCVSCTYIFVCVCVWKTLIPCKVLLNHFAIYTKYFGIISNLILKVVSATFLLVKESTLETMKNVLYFNLKALFALDIIKF